VWRSSPATWRKGDALATDLLDDTAFEPLDQADAGAQCLLEIEFTVHGAGGDFGNFGLQPQGTSEFVDAFLVDHG
jgi:hypothetical protein